MADNEFLQNLVAVALDNRRRLDDLDEPELNIVVTLDDLISGVRGDIIRREAAAWAAYSAKTDGAALVGDGTDILSTLTPTWKGEHRFNAGIEFGGASGINIVEIPDNIADAISIEDGGATEYLRIITTDTQPEIEFNPGNIDIDFRIGAVGYPAAFFIQGANGQVEMGNSAVINGYLSVGHGGSPAVLIDARSSDPIVSIRNTDVTATGERSRIRGQIEAADFAYIDLGVGAGGVTHGYIGFTCRNGAAYTEKIRFDYRGYAGFQTTSPSYPVHILGECDSNAKGPLYITYSGSLAIGTALTLDSTGGAGGSIYSFISTGTGAAGGAGDFAVFNGSVARYVFRVGPTGGYIAGANKYTELGQISSYTYDANTKGIVIRGSAAQAVALFEWQSSTPSTLGVIDSAGSFGVGTATPDRLCHIEISDAVTNAISYTTRLTHITSGTADVGFGVGTEYELEDDGGGNNVAGGSACVWSDDSAGSEDADFVWLLMEGGAAMAERARLRSDGVFYADLGIRAGYTKPNVSDPPTDAELDAAFGTPATLGDGFIGVVNDDGNDTDIWIVVATGAVWAHTAKLTIAV